MDTVASAIGFVQRNYNVFNPSTVPRNAEPLRFGILGAANIAPLSLITPAKSHPDVLIYAVAARDRAKADAYAKKHSIPKVHNSYQELLDDRSVNVIYNALPNTHHFEWTAKALLAGKHVLLEKPSTNTAAETRQLFALAEKRGLVLLEASHNRFHPANQRAKEIIASGELGAVIHVQSTFTMPVIFSYDDIRYNHALGGGALMDMGCYTLSISELLSGLTPTSVLAVSTNVSPLDPRVDSATTASLALPNNATAEIITDLRRPPYLGYIPPMPVATAIVKCEGGELELRNFLWPHVWHTIVVRPRSGKTRTEKAYKREGSDEQDWWSTYRHQLEAFVDKVRGREPKVWVSAEDSIETIHWVEEIYAKSGLGSRPASTFTVE